MIYKVLKHLCGNDLATPSLSYRTGHDVEEEEFLWRREELRHEKAKPHVQLINNDQIND